MPTIFSSLLPVVILISVGIFAGQRKWVSPSGAKELAELAFMVLTPALLFRTMSQVNIDDLDIAPVALYFGVAIVLFFLLLFIQGVNRKSVVLSLAATFSNTVMIGIPLVSLAFGPAGLVYLLTLISMHVLILLTIATVVLEFTAMKEEIATTGQSGFTMSKIFQVIRNSLLHPIPLPILVGLFFSYMEWQIPQVLDQPIAWMGSAFAPLALLMVGISLHGVLVGFQKSNHGHQGADQLILRSAIWVAVLKNLVHPLLVLLVGYFLNLQDLAFSVMVLAAAMPVGANVFMFSQRYKVAQEEITMGVMLTTLSALITLPLIMGLLTWVQSLP